MSQVDTATTPRHAQWTREHADLAAQVAEDRRRLRDGEISFDLAEMTS